MTPTSNARPMRVLLGTTKESPYGESAPGSILATFNAAVLGQLLKSDSAFDLKPGLIESWKWNFSSKSYTLKLKSGLKFHNGREITSKDLEFSLLRGFFSKNRSFYSIYLGNIAGIEKISPAERFRSGLVSGIEITGPLSLQVRLKEPNPSFLHSLVNPYFSLVPAEELNENHLTWKHFPVGAGPYKVIAPGFNNGRVALQLVQSTFNDAPKTLELITDHEKGPFDISLVQFPSFSVNEFRKEVSELPADVVTVFFSYPNSLGGESAFRNAVRAAVNRKELVAGIDTYLPTFELLPKHFWGRANLADPFNPKHAKELVSSLPAALTSKAWEIPVFSGNPFSNEYSTLFSRLEQQLKDVGLTMKFYPSTEKFISDKTGSASPMSVAGRVSDYVDPLIMFASFKSKSAFKYQRPEFDSTLEELYKTAASEQQRSSRVTTIQALSKYIDEAAVVVPLLERRPVKYFNPKTVKTLGVQDQPLTLFLERVIPLN